MNSGWAFAREHGAHGPPVPTSLWPDSLSTALRKRQELSSEEFPGLVLAKQRLRAGWKKTITAVWI